MRHETDDILQEGKVGRPRQIDLQAALVVAPKVRANPDCADLDISPANLTLDDRLQM